MRQALLVPASLVHVGPIATHMRAEDRKECEAFGRSPKQALRLSLATSFEAFTALDPETRQPLAMFGVSAIDLLQGIGTPWFLGRDEVFDYGRDLMARGPAIIGEWLKTFKLMENVVSESNVKAIRMLNFWGAVVGSGPTEQRAGVVFLPFRFGRP